MKNTAKSFISFQLDYDPGYFADQPPYQLKIRARGQVSYTEDSRRLGGDIRSEQWNLAKDELAQLFVLVFNLFDIDIPKEMMVCDGGSTTYKVYLSDGSKKVMERSHHTEMPDEFLIIESKINALLLKRR